MEANGQGLCEFIHVYFSLWGYLLFMHKSVFSLRVCALPPSRPVLRALLSCPASVLTSSGEGGVGGASGDRDPPPPHAGTHVLLEAWWK